MAWKQKRVGELPFPAPPSVWELARAAKPSVDTPIAVQYKPSVDTPIAVQYKPSVDTPIALQYKPSVDTPIALQYKPINCKSGTSFI